MSNIVCQYSSRSQARNLMLRNLIALLLCVSFASDAVAQKEDASSKRTLIKAKHVYTATGEVLSPGQVLIDAEGKISFVGKSIELALPAKEIEVDSIMPGIINAAGDTGLSGGAEVSREITPDFETVKAIDWESRDLDVARDQGVTTIQVLPATESVFCGFACVIKTGGESNVIDDAKGIVIAVCSDPTSRNRSRSRPDSIYVRQPTNRMGVVWIIRSTLHQVMNGGKISGADPKSKEILSSIVQGKTPVLSVSRADFDIRSALELGELYNFLPTIYGGDEVYRMMDEFKASKAKLVYTALTTSGVSLRGREGTDLRWNVPGKLNGAGVEFCLGGDNLLEQAQFAMRYGLPRDVALQSITLNPATILGLEKQIGSIEVGKDADLIGLSGDPLKNTSRIEWTMVDGEMLGGAE